MKKILLLLVLASLSYSSNAWSKGRDAHSAGFQPFKEKVARMYESIGDFFESLMEADSGSRISTVAIDSKMTASGMLGKPVYDMKGIKIGEVKDIILRANGEAIMMILSAGGLPGFGGRLVAFDYGLVAQNQKDGDILLPITEENLKKAVAFSYEKEGKGGRILSDKDISLMKLLDGDLLDRNGETVAHIENISLYEGRASQVIVAFSQGLGDNRAALNFNELRLAGGRDGSINLKLNAAQSRQFEKFKKAL